ncbi:flagellar biosynthesis regulator FlaF [Acidimangrovimonas sediminis]|uniref:flagellar biosynthesis regulator FlaF n=1 Tax=Acidimangrovimonas sediminis TaxID=2056283 RepID=UPI002FCDF216
MNMARTAYATPGAPTRTGRGLEYDVLARVTHRLKSASESNDRRAFGALVRALYDNRRLWTILATDVADPGNQLPESLRARIFYLNEFTQQHSRKVLARQATVDVLIDINTAVMRGLRSDPIAPPAPQPPTRAANHAGPRTLGREVAR